MWNTGLTTADRELFEKRLGQSHVAAVRVEIMDHAERPLGEATAGVLDASVTFDLTADVSRNAEVTVARGALQRIPGLDQLAYTIGAPGLFLRVVASTWVPEIDRAVEVPLFTGPVWGSQTQGDEVQLSATGKEALLQPPHLPVGDAGGGTSFAKGTYVTDVIRRCLQGGGEGSLSMLPSLSKRLQRPVSIGPEGSRWALCTKLARGIHRSLFFDGYGRVRLEDRGGGGPLFTFTADHLTSEPAISWQLGDLRNAVRVGYGNGARNHVLELLPAAQPASGVAMARRNGVPRLMVESLDDENLENAPEARAAGDDLLAARQLAYNVQLDSVLIPHLEPGDTVAVNSGGQATPFVLAQASLGLSADGGMTINYIRRLPRKQIRKGRRKR